MFRFIDLCGSERVGIVNDSNDSKQKMSEFESMWTNFSLTILGRVILSIADLKKPVTPGEDPPMFTNWKFVGITRILKSSFNGMAFTSFILCFSQTPSNSGETYYTMKFGLDPARLDAIVIKPKARSLKSMIDEQKKLLIEN